MLDLEYKLVCERAPEAGLPGLGDDQLIATPRRDPPRPSSNLRIDTDEMTDAIGVLNHGHGISGAGDDGHQLQLIDLPLAEGALGLVPVRDDQVVEWASERVPLPDR